jgi:hypothetical protein
MVGMLNQIPESRCSVIPVKRGTCVFSLFVPPVFVAEEQTQRARILHLVICATVLITVGFAILVMIQQPATISRGASAAVFVSFLGVLLLRLNQRVEHVWRVFCSREALFL